MSEQPRSPSAARPMLVIAKDPGLMRLLERTITRFGGEPLAAADPVSAAHILNRTSPAIVFLDAGIGQDATELALQTVRRHHPSVPVVLLAFPDEAVPDPSNGDPFLGAILHKPRDIDRIAEMILRFAPPSTALKGEAAGDEQGHPALTALQGSSPPVAQMRRLIGAFSRTAEDTALLIDGEAGTEREQAARALHELGGRPDEPFIVCSMRGLSEVQQEAELFGIQTPRPTEMLSAVPGLCETTKNGTLFLDSAEHLSASMQWKILRLITDRAYNRMQSFEAQSFGGRLILSTVENIDALVAAGTFIPELWRQLRVFRITIPPLRQRKEDIPDLARRIVARFSAIAGSRAKVFSAAALDALQQYEYPGNLDELHMIVDKAVLLSDGETIDAKHVQLPETRLPYRTVTFALRSADYQEARNEAADAFEREYLAWLLERHHGNLTETARDAGMTRQNLQRLIKKHGIEAGRWRRRRISDE